MRRALPVILATLVVGLAVLPGAARADRVCPASYSLHPYLIAHDITCDKARKVERFVSSHPLDPAVMPFRIVGYRWTCRTTRHGYRIVCVAGPRMVTVVSRTPGD